MVPRTNIAFALHDSSRIFLEKKIYLIMKLQMYICTEYIKSYIYKPTSRNFIGTQPECSKEEQVSLILTTHDS